MIVNELDDDEDNGINLKQSKHIICPICNEICLINLNDYKISFSNCKNGHRFTNIMYDEFLDFQKIDESKIVCDKCKGKDKNKKSEVSNNLFYKCCTCNIILCPLCKSNHDNKYEKNHLIINYDIKNYVCNEHGERYISHCKECNKDLCDKCRYDNNHYLYHKVSFLYEFKKKTKNKMNELRIKINDLTKQIPQNTTIFKKVIEKYEAYFNVANNIINSLDREYINFYTLNNINSIIEYNEKIIKDINIILNENVENKNKYISEIHQKMIIDNEFILKYKLGKVGLLRIFGKPFVAKNKNNFYMTINGINCKLSSIIKVIDIETGKSSNKIIKTQQNKKGSNEDEDKDNIEIISEELSEAPEIRMKIEKELEIKLKQIKTVKDISYMFSGCTTLEKIKYSYWDTNNLTNMECLFDNCSSLTSLPDISKWNTNNVTNMEGIFGECKSLTSLPDISNWNINKVTIMRGIFYACESLTVLPDISKWNTNNVTDMSGIFSVVNH